MHDIDYILLEEFISAIGPNFISYERGVIGTVAQKNSTTFAFMNNSSAIVSTVSGIIDAIEVVKVVDGQFYIPVSYITNVFGISVISNSNNIPVSQDSDESDFSIRVKIP